MQNVSLRTIVDGRGTIDYSVKSINFGSFAYIHTTTDNTMKTRSIPEVALHRSNNNGGYFFLNLETGERMHS